MRVNMCVVLGADVWWWWWRVRVVLCLGVPFMHVGVGVGVCLTCECTTVCAYVLCKCVVLLEFLCCSHVHRSRVATGWLTQLCDSRAYLLKNFLVCSVTKGKKTSRLTVSEFASSILTSRDFEFLIRV